MRVEIPVEGEEVVLAVSWDGLDEIRESGDVLPIGEFLVFHTAGTQIDQRPYAREGMPPAQHLWIDVGGAMLVAEANQVRMKIAPFSNPFKRFFDKLLCVGGQFGTRIIAEIATE